MPTATQPSKVPLGTKEAAQAEDDFGDFLQGPGAAASVAGSQGGQQVAGEKESQAEGPGAGAKDGGAPDEQKVEETKPSGSLSYFDCSFDHAQACAKVQICTRKTTNYASGEDEGCQTQMFTEMCLLAK